MSCDNCSPDASCWKGRVCQVSDIYLDGTSSWTAFEAKDLVYVGGEPNQRNPVGTNFAEIYGFEFTFGCQTALQGYFATNVAEGLLAMSPKETSFITQLYKAGKIPNRSFSLCFNSHISEEENRSVGAVTMARPAEWIHDTPMVFAANTDPANMYRLEIEKVYLHKDGQLLSDIHPGDFLIPVHADYVMMNSNSRGVFLDSGTPFTQLDKTLSAPFMEAWKSITNKDYSNDVLVDESDVSSLPTVVFQFKVCTLQEIFFIIFDLMSPFIHLFRAPITTMILTQKLFQVWLEASIQKINIRYLLQCPQSIIWKKIQRQVSLKVVCL